MSESDLSRRNSLAPGQKRDVGTPPRGWGHGARGAVIAETERQTFHPALTAGHAVPGLRIL